MDVSIGVEITGAIGISGSLLLLAYKAGRIIKSNEALAVEVRKQGERFERHETESNTREKANVEAIGSLRSGQKLAAEVFKNHRRRLELVEKQSNATDKRVDDLHTRVTVIEERG